MKKALTVARANAQCTSAEYLPGFVASAVISQIAVMTASNH